MVFKTFDQLIEHQKGHPSMSRMAVAAAGGVRGNYFLKIKIFCIFKKSDDSPLMSVL